MEKCFVNTYTYDEIEVGHKEIFSVTITEQMLEQFRDITGDINPLHNDEQYAVSKGYKGRVAYGMLTASFMSTLAGVYLPGERSLIHEVEIKFAKPVFAGDVIEVEGVVTEKNDTFSILMVKVTMKNQAGEKMCRGKMQIGVA